MSALIVLMFDQEDEAAKVRNALRNQERSGYLDLEDTAVVTRDTSGKIHTHNQASDLTKATAVGGGFLGLLVFIFFPVVGIAAGVAGGALLGHLVDRGIDGAFVKEVGAALKPGHSALFVIVKESGFTPTLATLRTFNGTVYHTTLSTEADESLRRALSEHQASLT